MKLTDEQREKIFTICLVLGIYTLFINLISFGGCTEDVHDEEFMKRTPEFVCFTNKNKLKDILLEANNNDIITCYLPLLPNIRQIFIFIFFMFLGVGIKYKADTDTKYAIWWWPVLIILIIGILLSMFPSIRKAIIGNKQPVEQQPVYIEMQPLKNK